jgi:hypothetical protein
VGTIVTTACGISGATNIVPVHRTAVTEHGVDPLLLEQRREIIVNDF